MVNSTSSNINEVIRGVSNFSFIIRFYKYKKAQNGIKVIQFSTDPTELDFVRIAVCTFSSLVGPV